MLSFPKPLDAKEEESLVKRFREGDRQARDLLIEHNLRLVAHIVKKYSQPERDNEDLLSIGTVGLIKAVDSFDGSKGIRLGTYAARCIENELLMFFRAGKKTAKEVYLYDPIGTDKEGNAISLLEIIVAEEEDYTERYEQREKLAVLPGFLLTQLEEREREIISLRYGLDGKKELTQREIADKLNISRSYVSRIEKKALGKLRKEYEKGMDGYDGAAVVSKAERIQ
ncbi:MAG: RNA polymerase sporulation sigma factor SigK [Lachnospiraceae bacterium]|nr:RNA polymerase sporulation sigma factor SigK [Lachnospiraceae bacterium]